MDNARAKRISEELIGQEVGGWLLLKLLGFGKSAVVFAGSKAGIHAAVKVFDPELIERFGRAVQRERVMRELQLQGHGHPTLIQILGGGEWKEYFYVVMELVEWPSLDQVIKHIPRERIAPILHGVASAAQYLEQESFAHRDIKPSNIVISPGFTDIKLLDLGVIRPLGHSDLTDEDARQFIGTLRYSSPEFLIRKEEDTTDGWRAITFYQLGGVLHDLIMREQLFHEFSEPYARLIHAVAQEMPTIEAGDVEPDLIVLAKTCLSKDPATRLRFVTWNSFEPKRPDPSRAISLQQRLRRRQQEAKLTAGSPQTLEDEREARRAASAAGEILSQIENLAREVVTASEFLPPARYSVSQNPEAKKGRLLARFEPSRQFALEVPLSVFIEIEIIEGHEKVIRVRHAVAVGPLPQLDDCAQKCADNYSGIFDPGALRERMDLLFHEALDKAQSEAGDSKVIAWLSLTSG